jgi:hypothetical protein
MNEIHGLENGLMKGRDIYYLFIDNLLNDNGYISENMLLYDKMIE